MSVKLSEHELDAALAFIEDVGASDFFPEPFEFLAIRHSWDRIREILAAIDLTSYRPLPAVELIAPKHYYTVRPIQLLDPIDLLLFTRLGLRLAASMQAKRDTYQQDRVFSCQFVPRNVGTPPTLRYSWDGYLRHIEIETTRNDAVATADIADFFTRVYLHRLHNGISAVTRDEEVALSVMNLLNGWSHGTSYGIPIGSRISNLVAEVVLIEVDEYLLSAGVKCLRYVDDYFLFGDSEPTCASGLFELGTRLMQAEGLTLNVAKTRLWTARDYGREKLLPGTPQEQLERQIKQDVFHGNPYALIEYETLTGEERRLVDAVDAEEWLDTALAGEPADLSVVRFVLNFLSAFQRPELVEPVMMNLPRLIPVSEAVGRFFSSLSEVDEAEQSRIGGKLLDYVFNGRFVPDYQTMWLLEPFTTASAWNHLTELRRTARNHHHPLVRRQAILAIGAAGDRSAIWDARPAFEGAGDWEARAIAFACRSMPSDERSAFYRNVAPEREWTRTNCLMKAVKQYALVTA